jgi:hypothetical protein
MEKVADYKLDELDRLEKMPIHNYFLHILALKKRADELSTQQPDDDF